MKSVLSLVFALGLASASVVEKRNFPSCAGSNNYYLHGLHPEEQAPYINMLKSYGTKVVRLWGEYFSSPDIDEIAHVKAALLYAKLPHFSLIWPIIQSFAHDFLMALLLSILQ